MTKNERIARLEKCIEALQAQVNQLQLQLASVLSEPHKKTPPDIKHFENKAIEHIQDDWAKRNLGILDKGPLPYAHKTGHAGSMTIGGVHDW